MRTLHRNFIDESVGWLVQVSLALFAFTESARLLERA